MPAEEPPCVPVEMNWDRTTVGQMVEFQLGAWAALDGCSERHDWRGGLGVDAARAPEPHGTQATPD